MKITMNKQELIKILKPYWKEATKAVTNYYNEINKIEEKMNKELSKHKLPRLEIFHVNGNLVGIGALEYSERKKFKLIHDSELT